MRKRNDASPPLNRFGRLASSWDMDDSEMGGCFGVDRRTFSRWRRDDTFPGSSENFGSEGAPGVLLRHYEDGQDTYHSLLMKYVSGLRKGCQKVDVADDEDLWEWTFAPPVSGRIIPHKTSVQMPNIAIEFPWGIRWATQRRGHLVVLAAARQTDFGLAAKRRLVIEHYDRVLDHYETVKTEIVESGRGQ